MHRPRRRRVPADARQSPRPAHAAVSVGARAGNGRCTRWALLVARIVVIGPDHELRAPRSGRWERTLVDSSVLGARYSEADEAFRAELRAWLDASLPTLAPQPARDAWDDAAQVGHRLATPAVRRGVRRVCTGPGVRRSRRIADRAADLLRGNGPRPRTVRRRELRRHAARGADAHRRRHRRAEGRRTCRRSCAATRCGARASPSRARAPTSRRCAPEPCATATTTC